MSKEIKLIPELRFPEFKNDGGWEEKTLQYVADSESSSLALNKIEHLEDGYPVYGADSIVGYIDEFQQEEKYISIVKDGSGAGRLNLCQPKSSILGTLACIKSKDIEKFNLEWIYYQMNTIDYTSYKKGSGIPHIYFSDFKKEPIGVPQPQEQQKIASCLSSLDELLAAHNEKLDTLKDHKKGLMQNLFPQEGETVPKVRFKEFEGDWVKAKLKDVSTYFNGKGFEGDVQKEGKYELITLKSVDIDGSLVHSERFINIDVSTLSQGTLVMILSEQAPGLLGMTAIIPSNQKYVLNQRVAEIRPKNRINSYFLSRLINSNQTYFSRVGAGMKVQNISKPNVENYELYYPTLEEQQKIASCLSALDELINAQTDKIEQLQQHKKGLMQGLFPKIES